MQLSRTHDRVSKKKKRNTVAAPRLASTTAAHFARHVDSANSPEVVAEGSQGLAGGKRYRLDTGAAGPVQQ